MVKKQIRIFLDSNVILSGLLSESGPPRIILDILCAQFTGIKGVTGEYNLIEIERNITKKMPDILDIYHKYLPLLDLTIIPIPYTNDIEPFSGLTNDKDLPVLVAAIKSESDFLVTGDKKDFGRIKHSKSISCKIVNPAELLDIIGQYISYSDRATDEP